MSLYPTKTRLALLQAVADGDVLEGITESTEGHTWLIPEIGPSSKVTARISELDRAGWVYLNEPPVWKLTEVGKAILRSGAVSS